MQISALLKTIYHKISDSFALPFLVILVGILFYIYNYLIRVAPSLMTHSLMSSYNISSAVILGSLSASYYFVYTPMQMPVGILVDRYGPRKMLTLAGLACALGMYLFAASHSLTIAELGRFLMGFGSAFAFIGLLKLAIIWLPEKNFGLISGITLAIGMLGGIFGDLTLTELVQLEGWRLTSYLAAALGLVLAFAMFILLRRGAKAKPKETEKAQLKLNSLLVALWHILKKPDMWLIGIIGCLMYLPISAFAELWGIPFLESSYHFTASGAATSIAFIFLGWAIGAPLIGYISDRIADRRLPLTIGAAMSAVLISIAFYVPDISTPALDTVFLLCGIFSGSQILVFALGRERISSRLAGTTMAFINLLVMLGGVIFQPAIGKILDLNWHGQGHEALQLLSTQDFQVALLILPAAFVLTVFLTFLLPNRVRTDLK